MNRRLALLLALGALVSAGCSAVNPPETVLVGGATGRQGSAVVDELLARGYRVRAMTRRPDSRKADPLRERGVELIKGDYGDRASLDAAMQGVNKVFFYSGFSRNELAEGLNVLAAAQAAGVEHLIYSSGAAAEPGKGLPGPKTDIELAIVASGIGYTVFRPVAFMENFRGQRERFITEGVTDSRAPDRMLHFIAVRDIGLFAGEAFDNPSRWRGVAVNIAGDRMTVQEHVDLFSRVTGQAVPYNRLPLDDFLATLPRPLRPLFRWYDEVGYDADVAALRAELPQLMTLEAWLTERGWRE